MLFYWLSQFLQKLCVIITIPTINDKCPKSVGIQRIIVTIGVQKPPVADIIPDSVGLGKSELRLINSSGGCANGHHTLY